ncbi:uncharacterized protein BDR25DRAFT_336436 [Lindgomyces ingoldianus]|uniref:Uncharacterized protein n=1 Tax=Lindgomyces ingoldianus TaxID=673940 RepID=A0ACB6QHT6_9PLEO|nr:uncharacterized protein BDR25DRAFT_336436 [Lindgomyces ingoldianus]KAF2466574.1 hypothetical protein BDR25DRAFT_336436 [Lindgomyces ingoldianus]
MDLTVHTFTGMTFGAALTASGVWNPSTIVEQMRFHDFHMLKVFMAASSASALMMHLLSLSGRVPNKPRPESRLLTGIPYDGNIIGGAMVGFGMTLTGACPGTVLVQIVTGTYPGLYSFIGGLAGGILYIPLQSYLRRPCAKSGDENLLLYTKYHLSPSLSVLAYESMCIGVIGLATKLAPAQGDSLFLPPVVGGLFIGAAQLVSLALRRAPVGISTAYEDIGAKVCGFFKEEESKQGGQFPTQAMAFAAGVMIGASTLVRLVPKIVLANAGLDLGISPMRAVLGGVVMVLGARLAGGCTSGHGISGMSMLATSSVVTVASMFGGGMALAQVMS